MSEEGNKDLPTLPDGDYAILEMMGHSTMVGRICEVEKFGTKFLQIEPIWENGLLAPVTVGGPSIYRLTPCSKEVAQRRQAKERYHLPSSVAATLPPEPPTAIPPPSTIDGDPDSSEVDETDYHEDDEIGF